MLSYSKGSEVPLRHDTVYGASAVAATRFPDRLAFASTPDNLRWTYRELHGTRWTMPRGNNGAWVTLHAEDRVAICAASCRECYISFATCFSHPPDARANYDPILKEGLAGSSCPVVTRQDPGARLRLSEGIPQRRVHV